MLTQPLPFCATVTQQQCKISIFLLLWTDALNTCNVEVFPAKIKYFMSIKTHESVKKTTHFFFTQID